MLRVAFLLYDVVVLCVGRDMMALRSATSVAVMNIKETLEAVQKCRSRLSEARTCLSVCLSVCLFVCLSVCWSVFLFVFTHSFTIFCVISVASAAKADRTMAFSESCTICGASFVVTV